MSDWAMSGDDRIADIWRHPETGIVIFAEDMPAELIPEGAPR